MSYLDILIANPTDWFQINMFTFSMRSIILGHHKTGTKLYQPIFNYFMKSSRLVQNQLFGFCTRIFKYKMYSCVAKWVPVLCLVGGPPQDFGFFKHAQKINVIVFNVSMECKLLVKNHLEKKHNMSLVFTYKVIYLF